MPQGYVHLTQTQRCRIEALKESGKFQNEIAKIIGVSRSTISRELRRNSGKKKGVYDAVKAHKKAKKRRSKASSVPRKLTESTTDFIRNQLKTVQSSPEQISGRSATVEGVKKVGRTTIYRFIRKSLLRGEDLRVHLRHGGRKYTPKDARRAGVKCIPNRKDISERPAVVAEKSRIGDFELDTIIGKNHKGAVVSVVDIATKYVAFSLLDDKTADNVSRAIIECVKASGITPKTFTSDNGKEFSKHEFVSKETGSAFYFAEPYKSWQRGLNEHTNGLFRQYFPKGTDFTKLTKADIQDVQNRLNNRPRKSLNFKTPLEAMREILNS